MSSEFRVPSSEFRVPSSEFRVTSDVARRGFTLIELSIALVIIGLIVGGVLVGKDLIEGAAIRAQVSQIEKYQTAVNTFRLKYNCLAGDCFTATQFGLSTAPGYGIGAGFTAGTGDGNSILNNSWNWNGNLELYNFWRHMSDANLIEGSFAGYSAPLFVSDQRAAVSDWSTYFPRAKVGSGYVVAVNVAITAGFGATPSMGNSFVITSRDSNCCAVLAYGPALTPFQSKRIDDKMDDGAPAAGRVQIAYPNYYATVDIPNLGYAPCSTGSPIIYNVTDLTVSCELAIKF